jgi:phosphate-selective porin OprO/OprP
VAATREAELEARIRQLEATVNKLSSQLQQISPPAGAAAGGSRGGAPGVSTPSPTGGPSTTGSGDIGSPGTSVTPSAMGGPGAPGQSLPPNPPVSARFDSPPTLENRPGRVKFGPGFEIRTDDDEFILQFHNLTQFDFRGYQQGGQSPVHDTFTFPRQWFMFSGRVSKPFGYFVSLANAFDTVSLLDCFLDVTYDPRLQFRIGRYKTPFTYEFLVEPIQGLIIPERSLFFNNFGLNRDEGIMAYGRLFNNKFDYAVGIFNGARNSFISTSDGKAVAGFINWRPFGDEENTLLENFNVGGSVYAANQFNLPQPQVLRTAVPTNGNSTAGVPFLAFNNDVREAGDRALWDLHVAWFYRSLAIIGEWGSGFQDYAHASNLSQRTHLPIQSFYVQAGYFLTGETRSSVGTVKPLHPFDPRPGHFGLGAFELIGRYDYLNVGRQVFTDGLADPNIWSNNLYMTDVGLNWHLTQYLKIYFDWEHAVFGSPVQFAPGRRQLTSDLFLARFQIYF